MTQFIINKEFFPQEKLRNIIIMKILRADNIGSIVHPPAVEPLAIRHTQHVYNVPTFNISESWHANDVATFAKYITTESYSHPPMHSIIPLL